MPSTTIDRSAHYRLGKAIRLVEEEVADDYIESHSGQLEMLPDGRAMVEEVQDRRRGRPKGSRNKSSVELAERMHRKLGNPIIALAEAYAFPSVKEIVLRDGITNGEAARLKAAALAKCAEYTERKMPAIGHDAGDGGDRNFAKMTDGELAGEMRRLSELISRHEAENAVPIIDVTPEPAAPAETGREVQ